MHVYQYINVPISSGFYTIRAIMSIYFIKFIPTFKGHFLYLRWQVLRNVLK